MRSDMVPGAIFPDSELSDQTAKRRKLSELQGQHPTVLVLALEELRQDLRAVTKKCRPDWDITTPELKAAWQQGRKELFYPYGKTYAQTLGEQD
jgi:hypothetical protein